MYLCLLLEGILPNYNYKLNPFHFDGVLTSIKSIDIVFSFTLNFTVHHRLKKSLKSLTA